MGSVDYYGQEVLKTDFDLVIPEEDEYLNKCVIKG